ncbi:hypothetical protein B0H13DRAFT_2289998, partial [Mycena leptocephala]
MCESQEGGPGPCRRRIPARGYDKNAPPAARTPTEPNARSLGQLRGHQRARDSQPQPLTPVPTFRSQAQQARRARERAEKEARMAID